MKIRLGKHQLRLNADPTGKKVHLRKKTLGPAGMVKLIRKAGCGNVQNGLHCRHKGGSRKFKRYMFNQRGGKKEKKHFLSVVRSSI